MAAIWCQEKFSLEGAAGLQQALTYVLRWKRPEKRAIRPAAPDHRT